MRLPHCAHASPSNAPLQTLPQDTRMPHPNVAARTRAARAFSLLEVLVVLGIVSVLVLILVPVTNSMVQSYQLNSAAQTIQNQLSQARQMAVTSGSAVQ